MLEYWAIDKVTYVEFFNEYYNREDAQVYESSADFFRALNSKTENVLIWTKSDSQIVFYLFSHQSKEVMVKIANSIKEK